ncbi:MULTISPECIES: hypothetical protein [unclassified Variovorax]|uniref:hypothetical protein n=1 Tax=unclassified Variovorax TaxID=663243 RepID=UPI003F48D73B
MAAIGSGGSIKAVHEWVADPDVLLIGALAAACIALAVWALLPNKPLPPNLPPPVADSRPRASVATPESGATVPQAASALPGTPSSEPAPPPTPETEVASSKPREFATSTGVTSLSSRRWRSNHALQNFSLAARSEGQDTDASLPPLDATASPRPKQGFVEDAVLWNYWLDMREGSDPVPQPEEGELALGTRHRLQFRLSTLDLASLFERVGTTAVSSETLRALKAAAEDPLRPEFDVDVVIHSVDDDRLEIVPGNDFTSFKIDLASVRDLLLKPESRPRPGEGMAILDVIRKATIAEFNFSFIAKRNGTHQVGITLVDRTTGYPLESLIVDITPGKPWPQSVQLDAGASNLFHAQSAPFDLALFFYDLKTTDTQHEAAKVIAELWFNDPDTGVRSLVSWRTKTSWPGLESLVATARAAQSVDTVPGDKLLELGIDLGSTLFRPARAGPDEDVAAAQGNRERAALARKIILRKADYKDGDTPPTMVTRVFSSSRNQQPRYSSLVLPMAAVGIYDTDESKAVYLGERFALSLLLSGQSVKGGTSCPADWHFALPLNNTDLEDGPLKDAMVALNGMEKNWLNEGEAAYDSFELTNLRAWLNQGEDSSQSFVFAYLGHHDTNRLYFQEGKGEVRPGRIERSFNGNSIAILNACRISLDHINDQTPVGVLAERGVASTVATTSAISGKLAAAYVDCFKSVLAQSSDLTIGQAHALTTQCLWSTEKGKRWGEKTYEFTGEALKYILIGNPFQRICAPIKRAAP